MKIYIQGEFVKIQEFVCDFPSKNDRRENENFEILRNSGQGQKVTQGHERSSNWNKSHLSDSNRGILFNF